LNLVGNAIKFTKTGEVFVRMSCAANTPEAATLRIEVQDTGIGLPPEAIERLFSSFSQVDSSTTRRFGGTGLGLAISKQLAELMGGTMGVESEHGRGSTFWFTLVLQRCPGTENTVPAPDTLPLAGRRALVLDDHGTSRRVVAQLLSRWGVTAIEAHDTANALELLRRQPDGERYDFALLDFDLANADGKRLVRALRNQPATRQLPLVMLTSSHVRKQCTELDVDAFSRLIQKPVRHSALRRVLLELYQPAASTIRLEQAPVPPRLPHAQRASLILIAEDNVVNQAVARRIAEKLGHRADVVGNGREALEALARIDYDLVLMDGQMPELDGYEATIELRRRELSTGRHVPVVALTANAIEGERERCLAAGMDDYLSKPVTHRDLASKLERWLPSARTEPVAVAARR
jgi:CheY-like chemotaxis protein